MNNQAYESKNKVCQNLQKPWITLEACSDWLLKLQTSFVIHLRATRARFAPANIVIIAGIMR